MIDSASSYFQSNIAPDLSEQAVDRAQVVDTSVIVPAYNEEEALPCVLSELVSTLDKTYEIVVVDDGSKDRTSAIAGEYPVRLISHKENRGKGAAMRTGIDAARGRKIIFIDADATYPVNQIPAIAERLDQYDLVRGIRLEGRDNIPVLNRLGNNFFVWLIGIMHQGESVDALTGLYGLRSEALRRMRLHSSGFDIESEIVIKAGAMRLRSICIPIEYNERLGEKKLNPFLDGLKILRRIAALAVMYKPFPAYVLPGLGLWVLAFLGMVLLADGPLLTSFAGFTTNSFVFSAMAFLAGFQLIVFGLIVNLYATETGIGVPSRTLSNVANKIPRTGGAVVSLLMMFLGTFITIAKIISWSSQGFGPFEDTRGLILALATIVWGMQLMCTMFILSLFSGSGKIGGR